MGVLAFISKKNLKFNILNDKSIFVDRVFESVFAEVWLKKNKKIIVGNIYRPSVNHPTLSSSEQFLQTIPQFWPPDSLDYRSELILPAGELTLPEILRINCLTQFLRFRTAVWRETKLFNFSSTVLQWPTGMGAK